MNTPVLSLTGLPSFMLTPCPSLSPFLKFLARLVKKHPEAKDWRTGPLPTEHLECKGHGVYCAGQLVVTSADEKSARVLTDWIKTEFDPDEY